MPIQTTWLSHSFGWNEKAGRYIDLNTGRFVPFSMVRLSLEDVIRATAQDIQGVSLSLQGETMSLANWRDAMADSIKTLHTASAAAARGGWAQMSQADWGWVGQRIRTQYRYLNNFAREIANGTQPLDGRFLLRARMYAEAGRMTYEEMRRRYMRHKGAVLERRVLMPGAEHCMPAKRPGCVDLSLLGWQPLGVLPPLGAAQCLTLCKCFFQWQDANGNLIGG